MTDEAIYKKRFLMFSAARLAGLALMILGAAIAFSDLVRDGGFRELGALFIALGAIESVVVPLLLKRAWERG